MYIMDIAYAMCVNGLLELLFPTRCAGCGAHAGVPLCPSCNSSLPLIRGAACSRCGAPMPHAAEGCTECEGRMRHLDFTVALARYEEPMRSVIHKFKYDNGWRLAPLLGAMAATSLAPRLRAHKPLLTFVPMHERRRRMRGYDHAERLAAGVGSALGLKPRRLLQRVRPAPAQVSLGHEERRRNVHGAFRAAGERLRGEEVVLVDDVLTTGHTLSACAAALKAGGAGPVIACVLARDLLGALPGAAPEGEGWRRG